MTALIVRLLPSARRLTRIDRTILVAGFTVLTVVLGISLADAFSGFGTTLIGGSSIRNWLSAISYVAAAVIAVHRAIRVGAMRRAFGLLALALSMYALGTVLWTVYVSRIADPPIPSVADASWMWFYLFGYAAIVALARARQTDRLPAGLWIDGLIAICALSALGAAILLGPVGESLRGTVGSVAIELAYPCGDLLLIVLVVGVVALRGWDVTRVWAGLAVGFASMTAADCLYAVEVASGAGQPGGWTNLLYVLSVTALAYAAWQETSRPGAVRLDSLWTLMMPGVSTIGALALLIYEQIGNHSHLLVSVLAGMTLLAAELRIALAFRDLRSLTEARRQASTDDLTELPNRRVLVRRIDAATRLTGPGRRGPSVMMLDLDHFKELNDTLGHDAGDALLRLIGPRLRRAVRQADTVARLGGDEFAILIDPPLDESGLAAVARRVLAQFETPFEVAGLALRVTASIGVASHPSDAADTAELLRHADVAMYTAKRARSGFEVYSREADTSSRERLSFTAELAAAIEDGGIEVHFQPKVDVSTRHVEGVEALARWRQADGTFIPPVRFVGAAEQAGLSRALTRRVLSVALDQLREWRLAGHRLHMSVNTTNDDLLDLSFPDEVAAALAERGLEPASLVLEVTETSVLSSSPRVGQVLERLATLGIGLSLDDFGTGYSSLAHLKSLPVGEVKVDRSFVAPMCTERTDAAIVRATVELAHGLGIRAVAEGVEDEETWQALADAGCHLIQGYAFSRPVPGEAVTRLLEQAGELPATRLEAGEANGGR